MYHSSLFSVILKNQIVSKGSRTFDGFHHHLLLGDLLVLVLTFVSCFGISSRGRIFQLKVGEWFAFLTINGVPLSVKKVSIVLQFQFNFLSFLTFNVLKLWPRVIFPVIELTSFSVWFKAVGGRKRVQRRLYNSFNSWKWEAERMLKEKYWVGREKRIVFT